LSGFWVGGGGAPKGAIGGGGVPARRYFYGVVLIGIRKLAKRIWKNFQSQ